MNKFKELLAKHDYKEADDLLKELTNDKDDKMKGEAAWFVGKMCESGGLFYEKDNEQARKWFEKSAKLGYCRGMCDYGILINNYVLVSRSCETGDSYCQGRFHSTTFYYTMTGDGLRHTIQHPDARKSLLSFLSDPNDMFCQYALANFHGFHIPIAKENIKWVKKSADQGYAVMQHCMGIEFKRHNKNLPQAWLWFKKAAAQGFKFSKNQCKTREFRNWGQYDIAQDAAITLCCIKKYKTSILNLVPKDIVVYIIARLIWASRGEEVWDLRKDKRKRRKIR